MSGGGSIGWWSPRTQDSPECACRKRNVVDERQLESLVNLSHRIEAEDRAAACQCLVLVGVGSCHQTRALEKADARWHLDGEEPQQRPCFFRRKLHHPNVFGVSALPQLDLTGRARVSRPVTAGQTAEHVPLAVEG